MCLLSVSPTADEADEVDDEAVILYRMIVNYRALWHVQTMKVSITPMDIMTTLAVRMKDMP